MKLKDCAVYTCKRCSTQCKLKRELFLFRLYSDLHVVLNLVEDVEAAAAEEQEQEVECGEFQILGNPQ